MFFLISETVDHNVWCWADSARGLATCAPRAAGFQKPTQASLPVLRHSFQISVVWFHQMRCLKSENRKHRCNEAPCGDRTHDHTLTEHMLYQLS